MRSGLGVGVPLALMQCVSQTLHGGVLTGVTPLELGLDVALAQGIYGKDRIEDSASVYEKSVAWLGAFSAMAVYTSDPYTFPLALIVPWLHYEYTSQKPRFARVKPLFVGGLWTMATYYQPFLIRHDTGALQDVVIPLSLWLLFTSVSHAADIPDIEEDLRRGIQTPATILGPDRAKASAMALLCASLVVHSNVQVYTLFDGAYDVGVTLAFISWIESSAASVLTALGLAFYLRQHTMPQALSEMWVNLLTQMLQSTEPVHALAIDMIPNTLKLTEHWPPPIRKRCIEIVVDMLPYGDALGSNFLEIYRNVVRDVYLDI